MTGRNRRGYGAFATLTWLALALGGCGCEDPALLQGPPAPSVREVDAGPPDQGGGFSDGSGIGTERLVVSRVAPNHGPFVGGNEAIVRGSGFTEEALVTVGGRLVQPADTDVRDGNRIVIVLPAGDIGPADVTVEVGDQGATLPDGYTYDSFYLEPNRGATAGGTLITLIGMGEAFAAGDRVLFGSSECTDLDLVSAGRATCVSPPGALGTVDVTLEHDDGTAITLTDAYEYYDSSDPFNGGVGGGPLAGTMNVTVLDLLTGVPVPEAFAILGEDETTEHQGFTNINGQVTFSGADLVGDQTVHVAAECYEKTSFVSFDAQDVTVFLYYTCPIPPNPGPPPAGRGTQGAFVSGELIYLGPNEMGPNPWNNVPEPRDGWERVSYVYVTQPCAGDSFSCQNPNPSLGGGRNRIVETGTTGSRGYTYRIFARPAAFAVYALSGLESIRTGEFIPYIMGVARNVLAGPGEEVTDVDMVMNIPLDHYLDTDLVNLPPGTSSGPDRFQVRADIDLGGEGLIVRRYETSYRTLPLNSTIGFPMDYEEGRSSDRGFRFFAQPALLGSLSDGRVRVEASWVTGDYGATPSTHVRRTGIREVDAQVTIDGWVGLPVATSPANGQSFPADRVLRWETEGGVEPDLYLIYLTGGDGAAAWRMFVRGDQTSAPVPNLSAIEGIDDVAAGYVNWTIYGIKIPGFDFDTVDYADQNQRTWSAWAVDVFTARR